MHTNKAVNDLAQAIYHKIAQAERIVIGAGAGLSASAGLDYNDPKIFKQKYSPFLKKGYQTIWQGIANNWQLNRKSAQTYWGFWAHHIDNIFYSVKQLPTYQLLYDMIKDKDYFVITTNADGQFFKGNFAVDKVFAMQGSYGLFQCQYSCHDTLYDNQKMIKDMLAGFDPEELTILRNDIPICPNCGELLCPNLRIDQFFVERPHMYNRDRYLEFINQSEQVLFIELGVGFNTPSIIRYPFEQMTKSFENASLIRLNMSAPDVPEDIAECSIASNCDINALLDVIDNLANA